MSEPLFVRYLDETVQVDPTGCTTVTDLIEKAQKRFSPQLDAFSLAKLTLQLYTGTQLKDDMNITSLINARRFINNYGNPLLIRYAVPVIKKTNTCHHSEERRKRWEELNDVHIQAEIDAAQDSGTESDKACSSLKWNLISPIYEPIIHLYTQSVKEIPLSTMDLLYPLVVANIKRYGSITNGKALQRLFFIEPILLYVAELFDDSLKIILEEDVKGVHVQANGHFEFMLKHNNKRLCIVLAKKDNMREDIAQVLVGMEIGSDVDGLNTVYGIVTNYVEWIFLKNHDDRIEMDEDVLHREHRVPTLESLKRIAGKIYALLSDE